MAVSEEQLKEIITSLLNECKTKGSIGSDALCDRLEKYDADPSQIDEIYRALEENKIKIIDDYEKDKELYEQIIKEISMDDPVKMYLKDIGKVPLLSADDEINLAKKMMDGDEDAKRCLSEANLRLDSKKIRRQRNAVSRSYSGRQPRAYESRRKIRLSERFQVFDLCNMVDSSGNNESHRRSGKNDKNPRSYG